MTNSTIFVDQIRIPTDHLPPPTDYIHRPAPRQPLSRWQKAAKLSRECGWEFKVSWQVVELVETVIQEGVIPKPELARILNTAINMSKRYLLFQDVVLNLTTIFDFEYRQRGAKPKTVTCPVCQSAIEVGDG